MRCVQSGNVCCWNVHHVYESKQQILFDNDGGGRENNQPGGIEGVTKKRIKRSSLLAVV